MEYRVDLAALVRRDGEEDRFEYAVVEVDADDPAIVVEAAIEHVTESECGSRSRWLRSDIISIVVDGEPAGVPA